MTLFSVVLEISSSKNYALQVMEVVQGKVTSEMTR
jgi:hypothetical protein